MMRYLDSQILAIVVVEKNKIHVFSFKNLFSTYFLFKTHVKHYMNLIKLIHGLKNTKKTP
jgi:hypothetical protein